LPVRRERVARAASAVGLAVQQGVRREQAEQLSPHNVALECIRAQVAVAAGRLPELPETVVRTSSMERAPMRVSKAAPGQAMARAVVAARLRMDGEPMAALLVCKGRTAQPVNMLVAVVVADQMPEVATVAPDFC